MNGPLDVCQSDVNVTGLAVPRFVLVCLVKMKIHGDVAGAVAPGGKAQAVRSTVWMASDWPGRAGRSPVLLSVTRANEPLIAVILWWY
jgi:hypothetical protein